MKLKRSLETRAGDHNVGICFGKGEGKVGRGDRLSAWSVDAKQVVKSDVA